MNDEQIPEQPISANSGPETSVPVDPYKDNRISIEEKDKEQDTWVKDLDTINMGNLQPFLAMLLTKYKHDYGTICHALAIGAVATAKAMNRDKHQGGISGFQSGAVMWEFIKQWAGYKGAMKLVTYDDMLYPQNESRFAKTIDASTFKDLQEKAQKLIDSADSDVKSNAAYSVVAHWKSIVTGKVPFGYTVEKEED